MGERAGVLVPGKIGAVHLGRDAYVYVRQSTLTQVREHTESLARQYELRERAVALGWDAHQVRVIDADLGRSGAEATAREGFKDLVADVGLGRVGIVFGIEVSRLARNNADWYQLLDLCALTDTLIADADGVYHPGDFNDRLVLGLKGTMSEAELHLIRSRLTAGLRHKAARGELRQWLPVGFDYDENDAIVMTADEAVAEAIATVFRRFAELGSARQVLLSLRGDGLLLPRRPARTGGRVHWQAATYPAVHDLLTNPVYAGAFVFGRTRTEKRIDPAGRVISRTVALPREQWEVLIPDHHAGFISWDTYQANTAALRANWRAPRGSGGGAAREGSALLQGRIRCGKCGRMMQTGYSGVKGNCPRYVCARAKQLYGGEKGCQSIGGRRLEQRVLEEVFAVLAPAALAATGRALADAEQAHAATLRAFELTAERARYEAGRARRQYDAVEPENRLVARTLERALEDKLAAQRQAERDLISPAGPPPGAAHRSRTGVAGPGRSRRPGGLQRARHHVPGTQATAARHPHRSRRHRRRRCPDRGHRDHLARRRADRDHHDDDQDRRALPDHQRRHRRAGPPPRGALRRHHHRAGPGPPAPANRHRPAVHQEQGQDTAGFPRHPRLPAAGQTVAPGSEDVVVVTVAEAERLLGVGKVTIYRWLRDGFLTGEQLTPNAPWRIRIDQAVRDRVVPQVPDGWVGLDQAAAILGIARQTVLHKVQRGELAAVHVNRGRRKGLRINVRPGQAGLFDQPR